MVMNIVILTIAIPTCYYSYKINEYGKAHAPEGFTFPDFHDLHKVLLGALGCHILRMVIEKTTFPLYMKISKGDTLEMKEAHAMKSAKKTY